jgi:hypothetical protein
MSAAPLPAARKPVWFCSKSKDEKGARKPLSNFAPCELPIRMPDGTTMVFPSVEAAFHGFKSWCVNDGSMSAEDRAMYLQQLVATTEGEVAKNLGRSGSWKKHGWGLNRKAWDAVSRTVMQYLLHVRAAVDEPFCRLVLHYSAMGPLLHRARFVHYEMLDGSIFVAKTVAGFNASMLGDDMVKAVAVTKAAVSDTAKEELLLQLNCGVHAALRDALAAAPAVEPPIKKSLSSRKRAREEA